MPKQRFALFVQFTGNSGRDIVIIYMEEGAKNVWRKN